MPLRSIVACTILAATMLASTQRAMAQELEPRSYSASPVGTNFGGVTYSVSSGQVSLDPSLPLSDVNATVNTTSVGLSHSFALGDRTASWAVVVPYVGAHVTGAFYGQAQAGARFGFSDLRARFALSLLGRALTPREFARRKPSTTLGVSLAVRAPTGTYDPTHFINVGTNSWAFQPEIGMEQPMGKWFADTSAAISIFCANTNFYDGHVLQQRALTNLQFHVGYNFRPGQWLAADANYYAGAATSVNGAPAINRLANSRYGLSFSQPLGTGFSTKLSWSRWLSGTYGQQFSTATLTLQYRWFDHPNS